MLDDGALAAWNVTRPAYSPGVVAGGTLRVNHQTRGIPASTGKRSHLSGKYATVS